MRFIGDIHGAVGRWRRLIEGCDESIQVGDFGLGFLGSDTPPAFDGVDWTSHRFIRGNHDDPDRCARHPGWIADGHYEDRHGGILYCGGAWSIDKDQRTPWIDWWPHEELGEGELYDIYTRYCTLKPRVMVTHDVPVAIARALFEGHPEVLGPIRSTRTAVGLQFMLNHHRPDLWVFGHWHISTDTVIDGTRFVCCAINEVKDIEL